MINLNLFLKDKDFCNITSPLILSVSAGVDSSVMLDLFIRSKQKIVVVIFDHHTRKQTASEVALIKKICLEKEIDFYAHDIRISKKDDDFQNKARLQRYEYLKFIASKYNTPYILTAHHADDLAETIFMKILRGSSLYGYAGIHKIYKEDNYIFIKPLLQYSKDEILEYASKNNVAYLEDSSNLSDNYLRNRIRHNIIPFFKKENPSFLKQALIYNNQLSSYFDFVRDIVKTIITNINSKQSLKEYSLNKETVRLDIITYLLEGFDIPHNNILINKIDKILLGNKPNYIIKLNTNYNFIKEYEYYYITSSSNKSEKILSQTLEENKEITINKEIFVYSNKEIEESVILCYNIINLPLILRNKQDGDILEFAYGHKKLKKLLIDKKIPLSQRNNLLVLTDSTNQILYIKGLYINKTLGENKKIYIKQKEIKKNESKQ